MSGNLLNNRYRIIEVLGSGGFGETFLAEDTQMPSLRRCVIKQLKPIANNPLVYHLVKERFQREAAVLEKLGDEHRQIPRLYAKFNENGLFYLVQEWIDGQTLAAKVYEEGLFDEAIARQVLVEVLLVLDFVHGQGMIHRDIKPDNIIMRQGDRLPVLIDFGSVKETLGTVVNVPNAQGQTTTSIVIGTPGFMPTEQAAGRPVFASDIYSLGMTIIYAITGKIPRELPIDLETGRVRWQEYASHLSTELIAILDRATQVYSRDRYANAREMLNDLQPRWQTGLQGSGNSQASTGQGNIGSGQNIQSHSGAAANQASGVNSGQNNLSNTGQSSSTTTPAHPTQTNQPIATRLQQTQQPQSSQRSQRSGNSPARSSAQGNEPADRQITLLTAIVASGIASLLVVLGVLALNSRLTARKPVPAINNPAPTAPGQNPNQPTTVPTVEQPNAPNQPIDRELAAELEKRSQIDQSCQDDTSREVKIIAPQSPLDVHMRPSIDAQVTASLPNGSTAGVVSSQGDWLEINSPVNGWIDRSATTSNCDRQVEAISFAPNQSSTTISSSFEVPGSHAYIVRANAGQVLVLQQLQGSLPILKDPNGQLVASANRNGDRAAFRLSASGIYTLEFSSVEPDYIYEFSLQLE
ncbi:serine/threonine protein kinase [Thalassoporum mexicanum PCC 7367]|uniref:serine/threonine-protein kinase n=1 Tax=Thalassoporum mexicanum TaxID=3457544 RepID=UPI00029FAAE9|nr:serine/threonine-protein kinase [Pseudanabaena sp. PCC 7367]AFY71046.1 serine/threonine protein kinase [Pseudanabaena sp. PCC 7367]